MKPKFVEKWQDNQEWLLNHFIDNFPESYEDIFYGLVWSLSKDVDSFEIDKLEINVTGWENPK